MTTLDNSSLKNELSSEFLTRNDSMIRWGLTISSFQAIPGLVGFWPMSSVSRGSGNVYDLSGQGRTLTYNGNPVFNNHNTITSYIEFDGTGDYLSRSNETDLQITGAELHYNSAITGLTMGGWFWNDEAGAIDGLIGKWTESGNQRSYLLLTASNAFRFAISSDGTASTQFSHTSTFSTGTWYFVVAKYEPSTRMSVFMNGTKASTTTSIPASIYASTAILELGTYSGSQTFDGRASMCFLSSQALSDALIDMLFQQSRILFGV